ncbi:hypothetical protein D9M72_525580 [compost metagenome]
MRWCAPPCSGTTRAPRRMPNSSSKRRATATREPEPPTGRRRRVPFRWLPSPSPNFAGWPAMSRTAHAAWLPSACRTIGSAGGSRAMARDRGPPRCSCSGRTGPTPPEPDTSPRPRGPTSRNSSKKYWATFRFSLPSPVRWRPRAQRRRVQSSAPAPATTRLRPLASTPVRATWWYRWGHRELFSPSRRLRPPMQPDSLPDLPTPPATFSRWPAR